MTPNRMLGQVSAIYLFWLNLAGIGTGPIVVAQRYSLAALTGVTVPLSALFFWLGLGALRRFAAE